MSRPATSTITRGAVVAALTALMGAGAALAGAAEPAAKASPAAAAHERDTAHWCDYRGAANTGGVAVNLRNRSTTRSVALWVLHGTGTEPRETRDALRVYSNDPAVVSSDASCWGRTTNGKHAVKVHFKWVDGTRGFSHSMTFANPLVGRPTIRCCDSGADKVEFKALESHSWTVGDMVIEARRLTDARSNKRWDVFFRNKP